MPAESMVLVDAASVGQASAEYHKQAWLKPRGHEKLRVKDTGMDASSEDGSFVVAPRGGAG